MKNVTGGTRKAVVYGLVTATCFSVTFALAGYFIVHRIFHIYSRILQVRYH